MIKRLIHFFHQNNKVDLNRLHLNELSDERRAKWLQRIQLVKQSKDNEKIPRHEKAGEIVQGKLILHNGIKVEPLSYGSYAMLRMLMENKGVHEPEQELIFQQVLKKMPESASMIELGSYWAFYSLWFCQQVSKPQCVLVEPNPSCLKSGKQNFKINGYRGSFIRAAIGHYQSRSNITASAITLDTIIQKYKLKRVDILHADIQGQEMNMLKGAEYSLSQGMINYIFLSTHTMELHEECLQKLHSFNFKTIKSIPPDMSSFYDGLLVMKNSSIY